MQSPHTRRTVLRATGTAALATTLAGCSSDDGDDGGDDGGSDESTTEPPTLHIETFVYCAESPEGYDDYEEQPDATYAATDTIWVYLDVRNLESEAADGDTIAVDLTETLTVTGPAGSTVLEEDFVYDNEFDEGIDLSTFFLVHDITLPSSAGSGEYEVTSSLEDGGAGETTERTEPFTVE